MSLTQSAAPSASDLMAEGAVSLAPAPQPFGRASDVGIETREAATGRHRLEVHVDRVESILVITPVGDIDIVTGGLFLEALIAAVSTGESRLIVDLRRVPFMDSTGPTIFISAHRALRMIEAEVHIVATAPVAEIFQLAWMDKFFPLHDDLAEAVAALRAPTS